MSHRKDQSSVSLTVDGQAMPFVHNRREGGSVTSEDNKSFPGGMRPQKAHGAPATVDNVTLGGEFEPNRDHEMLRWLKSRVGKGKCVVTEQQLDVDGNTLGRPDTWTGVLLSVSTGEYDASSGEPRELEIEVSTDGAA